MATQLSALRNGVAPRSVAVEDYVKCIWTLEESGDEPTGSAIATKLEVSPASVTGMGRKLVQLGLVEQEPYRPWRLTASGRLLALEIVRHHRLLELFLARSLGMGWDRIHAEAEVLEHHISEELEELIATALGDPEFDPHGHPIPMRDGTMPTRRMRSILDVAAGDVATIQQVRGETPELLRYLHANGLHVGTPVTVVAHEPVAGTTTVRVSGEDTLVVMGSDLASRIDVDGEPHPPVAGPVSAHEPTAAERLAAEPVADASTDTATDISRDAGERGSIEARIVAVGAATVALLVAALAAVLFVQGAPDADRRVVAADVHAAMHGTGTPEEARAAMIGDQVPAPGGPNDTDDILYPPPAEPYQPGRLREFTLDVEETVLEIAPGLEFPAWTFNGSAPGPVLRVTEGDRVRITLRNKSTQPHTLHSHGIHASDQDGVFEIVEPGDEHVYEFIAGPAGVMPYHCHVMPLKKHIGKGLYGTLIIDPKVPRPEAKELTMVMNAFDTNYDGENEVYAVNGKAFYYAKYPIKVKRGELVRIFLTNMTENDPLNSFHLHGNFFNYWPVTYDNPKQFTDVITQIQGDRGILEVRFPEVGEYMFHAHQTEFGDLGWMGFFEVEA